MKPVAEMLLTAAGLTQNSAIRMIYAGAATLYAENVDLLKEIIKVIANLIEEDQDEKDPFV